MSERLNAVRIIAHLSTCLSAGKPRGPVVIVLIIAMSGSTRRLKRHVVGIDTTRLDVSAKNATAALNDAKQNSHRHPRSMRPLKAARKRVTSDTHRKHFASAKVKLKLPAKHVRIQLLTRPNAFAEKVLHAAPTASVRFLRRHGNARGLGGVLIVSIWMRVRRRGFVGIGPENAMLPKRPGSANVRRDVKRRVSVVTTEQFVSWVDLMLRARKAMPAKSRGRAASLRVSVHQEVGRIVRKRRRARLMASARMTEM